MIRAARRAMLLVALILASASEAGERNPGAASMMRSRSCPTS